MAENGDELEQAHEKEIEPQDADNDTAGPGSTFSYFQSMEDILEKLKLLNYDHEFVKKSTARKAVTKHYFAVSTNPGEQFFMFTSLAAWLIQKSVNPKFETPQEYDDPNASISRILDELRKLDIAIDFSPVKLKSGAGENCVFVLEKLCDAAISHLSFVWTKSQPPAEEPDDAETAEEEQELRLENFEEDPIEAADDDDDDGNYLDLTGAIHSKGTAVDSAQPEQPLMLLENDVDPLQWKLEVERVLPSLKVTVRPDAKDWRSHIEQMQQLRSRIADTFVSSKSQLEKLSTEITRSLEKIQSREKYLNQQLEGLLVQFRSVQDRLAETKEKYKEASIGVTERSRQLAQVTEELEQIKSEMEERGSSLTDGAPLVRVKQAISNLQRELLELDVKCGVLEHALFSSQLRGRTLLQVDLHTASYNAFAAY